MTYTEYRPHLALAPYIDAYWQVITGMSPCTRSPIKQPSSSIALTIGSFVTSSNKNYHATETERNNAGR
ncbi:hypothetical protein ACN9ML_13215 [Dyadobacter endophyticus]|uniref:hypothetical protein n=1 Tax=Dyadobacter endophyticus TaxID=1749036 RepID=UPI00166445E6|nr:hypothetical protein [Dyadobacter endophyticus]